MGKKLLIILASFLLLTYFWAMTPVQAGNSSIRVCLSKGSNSAVFQIIEGDYIIQDMVTLLPITNLKSGDMVTVNQTGKTLTVVLNGNQIPGAFSDAIQAIPEDEDELNVFSYKNTLYRDALNVTIDSGSILAVNNIDLEHYLYGVVGQEMGYTAPKEALKAQAVVSRTFALCFRGRNLKYDVSADTYSQVYGGYSAEQNISGEKIIDAVDATKGRVIYYNNKKTGKKELIQAFFHSNAGGYTENSENVWNEALPYLKAVPSKEDKSAAAYSDETGNTWAESTYRWEKSLSLEEIQEAIDKYNIGEFQSINLYRLNRDEKTPTLSGRVTRMELVGSGGKVSVYRDNIRSVFDLRSTKFDIVTEGSSSYVIKDSNGKKHKFDSIDSLAVIDGQEELGQLSNSLETCQVVGESGKTGLNKSVSSITFIGQGYGHGLGMSQWGARGMDLKGYNYKEIIDHYYNQGNDDDTITIERY